MIKLVGTEKQVEWAQSIISDALSTIEANRKKIVDTYPAGTIKDSELKIWDTINQQYQDTLKQIEAMPHSAAFVIDNRKMLDSSRIIWGSNQLSMEEQLR